ncbi:MAG: hypothetical protein Alis3KO_05290 [Aliiglaciecola sp.]
MTNEQNGKRALQTDDRVERYVLDRMSETEAEEFEAYFLSNQACLDELEITEKIHQGMQSLKFDDALLAMTNAMEKKSVWRRSVPMWSVAAVLLIVVMLPRELFYLGGKVTTSDFQVISIEMAEVRSDQRKSVVVELDEKQTLLSFYVDTEMPSFDHKTYHFLLLDAKGQTIFEARDLTLNNASTLFVNLGERRHAPGQYTFEIYGGTQNRGLLMQSGRMQIKHKP